MLKNILKSKIFSLGLTLLIPTLSISACNLTSISSGSYNNPFYPRAELRVSSVSSNGANGVGIVQSINYATESISYQYNEPNVVINNLPGLPRTTIKQVIVSYNVGNIKIQGIKFPVTIEIPAGGSYSGSIPVLRSSDDFRKAAYPNDTLTTLISGTADIVLVGIDDNGYPITVKFTTSVSTSTVAQGQRTVPVTPSPSASASINPALLPLATGR